MSTGSPLFQLVRLPFAEDVSAGAATVSFARLLETAAQAPDINLLEPERLSLLRLAERCEARGVLADADPLLAAHASELA